MVEVTTVSARLGRAVRGMQGLVDQRRMNPIVFLDIGLESGEHLGRMKIELRADLVPKACENFRVLCTGERGQSSADGIVRFCLRGSCLHRVVRDSHCQGGDLKNGDGSWSRSPLNDDVFEDENFILRHTGPGVLSMSNRGPDSNGSHFFITFAERSDFDEKHVVFGCVADEPSLQVLYAINRIGSASGLPLSRPIIRDCGQLYPIR